MLADFDSGPVQTKDSRAPPPVTVWILAVGLMWSTRRTTGPLSVDLAPSCKGVTRPCYSEGDTTYPDGKLVDERLGWLLDQGECLRLLASETLGRVGISVGALPVIFPVNYSMVDGDIVFRTGDGLKLKAALDHTIVAFEVDRADPELRHGWSVLVVGLAEEVLDEDERLARIVPRPWVGGDRPYLIRIRPDLVSGRSIQ